MSIELVVVVRLDAQASALRDLIGALDAQTMPPTDFEVVLVGTAQSGDVAEQVADLARRRPNVRVAVDAREALRSSSATWALGMDARDLTLRRGALEKLVEQGQKSGRSVVLGRVDLSDGRELDDALARDADEMTVSATTALTAVVLQRRDLAVDCGLITDETSARAVLTAVASEVAVVGDQQCASWPSGVREAQRAAFTVDSASATWEQGKLVVNARGSVPPGTNGDVMIAVRAVGDGNDYWVPTAGSITADGTFNGVGRLDVTTVANGDALPEGRWALTVGVHGRTERLGARRRVPHVLDVRSEVVGGRPVVVEPAGPSLVLDVGATKQSIIGRLSPGDVTIAETYRGTVLRARLPRVRVWGDEATGSLLLGRFALPARIVGSEDEAHLECYLSGLAGTSHLSSRFGRVTASAGLDLDISGTGEMSVAAGEPPAKVAPVKQSPTRPMAKPPVPRHTAVQKVRRAVPGALEPVVARARCNRTAVRIYRKALGLPNR